MEMLRKALEIDQYKRPVFRELKVLYDAGKKKSKVLRDNKIKKLGEKYVSN